MKRTLILLLITMLARISAFSSTTSDPIKQDSIVYVTTQDIKYANLIFIQHKKLTKDNALLLNQIENYKDLTSTLTQVDSLRLKQIEEYSALNDNYQLQIESLNKDIKKKNRTLLCWKIGGITVSAGLLLFLLLK